MSGYIYLIAAILTEVVATTALKASDGFTKFGPSIIVIVGYSVSFYCLSIVLKTIPVGLAYAIWSGMGIVLITLLGWFVFNQRLDLPALLGMGLIVAGVIVIYSFSEPFTA
jgi:small multidrug resistance pump